QRLFPAGLLQDKTKFQVYKSVKLTTDHPVINSKVYPGNKHKEYNDYFSRRVFKVVDNPVPLKLSS
ncbi:MAG: hypothetical protein R6U11_04950, partial [Bacteroidales bacterium]